MLNFALNVALGFSAFAIFAVAVNSVPASGLLLLMLLGGLVGFFWVVGAVMRDVYRHYYGPRND